ncbi:MAG: FAD-binding oxidoreductase [Dehalococcoidia bacterium]
MVATQLSETAVEAFEQGLRGELVRPGGPGYDEVRQIWNAMIDKRPALIARCAGVADVIQAVAFARQHDLSIAIRGGGHNIAGNAVCDDGLMIDLSMMRSVHISPESRRAWVEPGATLGDFDHEAQAFGLATPLGINSTTGVAGLTLGGGFGWLSRKYGMTVDNLLSANVVTADGKLVHACAEENADLFWAIRGGSGNFGIVTTFEFQLHPVGPEILSGLVVFPFDQAKQVLKKYSEFVRQMPDDLSVWMVTRKAPPLPFLPPDVVGTNVVVFAVFYTGGMAEGQKLVDQVRAFGTPIAEHVGPTPYAAWQQAFDPLLTPGARNYWKSHNFSQLSDGAIDTIVEYAGTLPSDQCEIFLGLIGAQTTRVAPDATAYAHRDAIYVMNVHGRWETAQEDERGIAWAREFFQKSAQYATGGVYVNFMTQEETDRVAAAYGPNFERLQTIKQKYDPGNVFRINQNITPA